MRCSNCKKADTLRKWNGTIEVRGVKIHAHGMRCKSCEDIVFDLEEAQRHEVLIADAIVERGIRTASDFKFVRKMSLLTAADVADLFDVRAETISRWERGEIDIPRVDAFALGELFKHPRAVRKKLAALA